MGNLALNAQPGAPVTVNDQIGSSSFDLQVPSDDEAEAEIEDLLFKPKVLFIRAGTTVKFANKDEVPQR